MTKDYEIIDSGAREQFSTGSVRDIQEGKGRFDLLPWNAMWLLAIHFEKGCKKYGENNWTKGQPLKVYANSALRHIAKWLMGWTDEDHLVAAGWNIICAIATREWINEGKLPAELALNGEALETRKGPFPPIMPDDLDTLVREGEPYTTSGGTNDTKIKVDKITGVSWWLLKFGTDEYSPVPYQCEFDSNARGRLYEGFDISSAAYIGYVSEGEIHPPYSHLEFVQ